ncbi:MAG: hypothetical protein ACAH88_10725, partial [Roseimicrobium sp.]
QPQAGGYPENGWMKALRAILFANHCYALRCSIMQRWDRGWCDDGVSDNGMSRSQGGRGGATSACGRKRMFFLQEFRHDGAMVMMTMTSMKLQRRSLPALGVVAMYLAMVSMASALEPGIYELGPKGEVIKPFTSRIIGAMLVSTSNDNTRCTLTLNYDGEYEGWLGVQAAGKLHQGHGQMRQYSTIIQGKEAIREITERYKPEVTLRKHPGHKMLVNFFAKDGKLEPGEPFTVILRITNVGDAPFTFVQGGRQRGSRDNQFAFSAMEDNAMLPDIGNPRHMGGLGGWVTIKPGASHEIPADLTKWFQLKKGGFYTLRGSYAMEFSHGWDSPTRWEDFATADFYVHIKE